MPTRVRSHAKINLGLGIGAPRRDGFHGLTTLYQTLEVFDVVTVTARPAAATSLRLTANDSRVPTDSRNTAWKMISLVLEEIGSHAEVAIHIDKRLPIQGGLGAGSANAVAALVGLERELGIGDRGSGIRMGASEAGTRVPSLSGAWEAPVPDWPARRLQLAARVGSDVPLFLVGGTVLGVDRGQQVSALPDLEPLWCVLAIPATGVSTPQAFRDWDALCAAEGLTAEASADKLNRLSHAYRSAFGVETPGQADGAGSSGVLAATNASEGEDLAGPVRSALVRTGITSWIENDFERVVFPQHPSLAEIKRLLAAPDEPEAARSCSCLYAALSGSGSALFGLYPARGAAQAAADRLKHVESVDVRLTRTIPRAEYWSGMILEAAGSL
ncbi:MAG: 4-(cytidine 5'-diphospho)-2-C-methyl-D-erythritol kinase [Acidobacteriota bacterium]